MTTPVRTLKSGHQRPRWRFTGGPIVARAEMLAETKVLDCLFNLKDRVQVINKSSTMRNSM